MGRSASIVFSMVSRRIFCLGELECASCHKTIKFSICLCLDKHWENNLAYILAGKEWESVKASNDTILFQNWAKFLASCNGRDCYGASDHRNRCEPNHPLRGPRDRTHSEECRNWHFGVYLPDFGKRYAAGDRTGHSGNNRAMAPKYAA